MVYTLYILILSLLFLFPQSDSLVEGPVLNITRVRREHFSSYICFANNGVPPPASYQVNLEVSCKPNLSKGCTRIKERGRRSKVDTKYMNCSCFYNVTCFSLFFSLLFCLFISFLFSFLFFSFLFFSFAPSPFHLANSQYTVSPTIKTRQQMVGTNNGSSVVLECQVEAYPPALIYWVQGESRMIESNWKYKVMQQDSEPYTNYITLNITYVEPSDYGLFKCVAKNERGKTFGLLTLYGQLMRSYASVAAAK